MCQGNNTIKEREVKELKNEVTCIVEKCDTEAAILGTLESLAKSFNEDCIKCRNKSLNQIQKLKCRIAIVKSKAKEQNNLF